MVSESYLKFIIVKFVESLLSIIKFLFIPTSNMFEENK